MKRLDIIWTARSARIDGFEYRFGCRTRFGAVVIQNEFRLIAHLDLFSLYKNELQQNYGNLTLCMSLDWMLAKSTRYLWQTRDLEARQVTQAGACVTMLAKPHLPCSYNFSYFFRLSVAGFLNFWLSDWLNVERF